jgi:iron complex outermembrane receptor protein
VTNNDVRSSFRLLALLQCLLALFLVPAVMSHAQATAKIAGTIVDAQGDAVSNATVTVTNNATGAKRTVQADSNGAYAIDGLAAGTYTVSAKSIGFDVNAKSGIVLGQGQSKQTNFTLQVSAVMQEVTVNAGVESVAVQSAPSGGFLEERSAQSLVANNYIENFTSPIADYGEIVQVVPGTFTTSADGVGLGQSKTYFRGFADGSYDIDFDGIPFFDTNSPSHHSWAFFPSQWVGGVDVDRSPGTASTIGPDPFGGTIHLLSKPLTTEQDIRGSVSYGSWNTELYDAAYNSGLFGPGKKMNLFVDWHQMSSNGFQTQNYNQRDGGSLLFQYQISPRTVLTGYSGVIQLSTNAPNISSSRCMLYGVSSTGAYSCAATATINKVSYVTTANGLAPYTGSGIKFLLTAPTSSDPANWFSSQYNKYHIPTDFEYVGLKKDMPKSWNLDFKGYTYNYDNAELYSNNTPLTDYTNAQVVANPSLVPGSFIVNTTTGPVAFYDGAQITPCNAVPSGGTALPCGVDKYNSYRKYGETSMLTQSSQLGIFRGGLWYEWARTDRHQYPTDPTNNWADQALPNFSEQFWTNSFQPYAEYEFHVTPQFNITPGLKFFSYGLDILHHADNGATVGVLTPSTCTSVTAPCSATARDSGTFTAWLPSLDFNYRIQSNWSAYVQVAKGSAAPPSSVYDYNHTVSSSNPNPGLDVLPKQQKSTTYQIGTVYKGNKITLDADAYRVRFQNSYSNTTDTIATDATYGQTIYYLQPSSITQGLEFESTAVLAKGLNFYMNGTAGNAYYHGTMNAGTLAAPYSQKAPSGLWVANTPTDTEFQGLTYTDHGFDLGFFNHRVGEQRVDNKQYHNQAIVPAFDTVNTFVNYTVRNHSFFDGTKIRLGANNLLNSVSIQNLKLGAKPTTTTFVGSNGTSYTDQFNATTAISGSDTPSPMAGRSFTISVTFGLAPKR